MSPNASFGIVHELAAVATWNDGSRWAGLFGGRFSGFVPTLTVARELSGTASGPRPGTFVGLTLRPRVTLFDTAAATVAVGVPVELGLSAGDYYDDDTGDDPFGYVSAGLSASTTLGFVPKRFGTWTLSVTGKVFRLGSRMAVKFAGQRPTFLAASSALPVGL